MIREVPATKLYICDICKVTEDSQHRQNTWYVLIMARTDTVNYAGSMNKHLCPHCYNDVFNLLKLQEEKYAKIRDMGEVKDTLGNKDVIAKLQKGHMENNPRSG